MQHACLPALRRVTLGDDDVLLGDLAGVLVTFEHETRLPVLGDRFDIPPQLVDLMFWDSAFSDDCDAGRYPDAAAVAHRGAGRRMTRQPYGRADTSCAWEPPSGIEPLTYSLRVNRSTD
jgi:hypothetical protein